MESRFDIITDVSTLERSARGSITGVLVVRCGEFWFPESGWNDFAVVVVGWWARQVAALRSGSPGRFEFMDGPFYFTAHPHESEAALEFLRRASEQGVSLHESRVLTADIVAAVARTSEALLKACDLQRWSGADIEELRLWRNERP